MEQSSLNPKRDANTPRIYVASLADYVAGRLHGRWIDADQPIEVIREEIAEMLAESKEPNAEQWLIQATENFRDLQLSEHEDIELVAQVAFEITQRGPLFASLLSHLGGVSQIKMAQRYSYMGEYSNVAEYAQQFIEEQYAHCVMRLPRWIQGHIDYEGIANDMEMSGQVLSFEHDGKLHVFHRFTI